MEALLWISDQVRDDEGLEAPVADIFGGTTVPMAMIAVQRLFKGI
jgi:hypothetical protein